MGSFNFGDYNQIKNGSYKKLVKSYYSEQTKDASSKDKTTNKTKPDKMKDTTGLSQMKKEADGLKSAVDAFNSEDLWKETDGKADMNKIADAVKNFAKEYNDVIDQAGKVNSTNLCQRLRHSACHALHIASTL